MSVEILERVRKELLDRGVVASNKEFCVSWLARDESYLRVLRFHRVDPSADALVTLASKLGYYAEHSGRSPKKEHVELARRFADLRDLCQQAIEQQAKAKWMTPERMGL